MVLPPLNPVSFKPCCRLLASCLKLDGALILGLPTNGNRLDSDCGERDLAASALAICAKIEKTSIFCALIAPCFWVILT